MAPRIVLFISLGLSLLQPAARAGGLSAHVGGVGLHAPRAAAQLQGQVRSLVLTNRLGRRVAIPLPSPRLLSEGLPVPAGDWTDLEIHFDGPVHLDLPGGLHPRLALQALTVPLADPAADGERLLFLDLCLPEVPSDGASLLAAMRDGVLATERP